MRGTMSFLHTSYSGMGGCHLLSALAASRAVMLAPLLLIASYACTSTNITPPPPPVAAEGIVLFASNRSDNNFEIYRVAADGRALRRLTTTRDANDRAPALSPDGRRVAWERELTTATGDITSVEIWAMDPDGGNPRVLIRNGSFNRSPSWGPSGELVYASRVTGADQIFRLDAGAATPRQLTTGGAADQWPRLSSDGQWIVFQSNRGLDFDIYRMRADGSDVVNLTRLPGDDRFPAWTPDGAKVVWTRFDDASLTFDLFVMTREGTAQSAIVSTPFNELTPSVSPDGMSVVYQTDRAPPATLFVSPIAGGQARPLTEREGAGFGSDVAPWWGRTP